MRRIREPRGQQKFRQALIERYDGKCVVTGCKIVDVLEAPHICPYRGVEDNSVENGLLLRADIYTLFDLDLIGIDPKTLKVKLHPKLVDSGYRKVDNRLLRCRNYRPSNSAL